MSKNTVLTTVICLIIFLVTIVTVIAYRQALLDASSNEKAAAERLQRAKARRAAPKIGVLNEAEKQGVISGRLTYPSEGIPDSMAAHAINLDTYNVYSTDKHIVLDSTTPWGTYGYELSVPTGTYYVFGTTTKDFTSGQYRASYAFYTEFMKCFDSGPDCEKNRRKSKIKVETNSTVKNITVGDWWLSICRPRDNKVSVEWLLEPVCERPSGVQK